MNDKVFSVFVIYNVGTGSGERLLKNVKRIDVDTRCVTFVFANNGGQFTQALDKLVNYTVNLK